MRRASDNLPDAETLEVFSALRQAAKNARALAAKLRTPFYVVKDGRLVDLNAGKFRRFKFWKK